MPNNKRSDDIEKKIDKYRNDLGWYFFWKGLYAQRKLHFTEPDLVSKGHESLQMLAPLFFDMAFEFSYMEWVINRGTALMALKEFPNEDAITHMEFPAWTIEPFKTLVTISNRYGFCAYNMLHVENLKYLLDKIQELHMQYEGYIPIYELREFAIPRFLDFDRLKSTSKFMTEFEDKKFIVNHNEYKSIEARRSEIDTMNRFSFRYFKGEDIENEESLNFIKAYHKECRPNIRQDNYSRAVGLWLWDQKIKTKLTMPKLIDKFKEFGYTFSYMANAEKTFRLCYASTRKSIETGEVQKLDS